MQHNVLLKIPFFDDMMLNLFDWRVGVVSVPVHRASAPHWHRAAVSVRDAQSWEVVRRWLGPWKNHSCYGRVNSGIFSIKENVAFIHWGT